MNKSWKVDHFILDNKGIKMIYKKVAEEIRHKINSTHYKIGDLLPNEKTLAQEYQVSRMTLRRAIEILIKSGLIKREQGRGTTIIGKDAHFTFNKLQSFQELMKTSKQEIKNEVIDFRVINCPFSISEKMKLSQGERIFYIRRVRYINDKPVLVEDSYMPYRYFKNLTIADMEKSKFNFIENICHIKIEGNYEESYAILPEKDIQTLLKIESNFPVLLKSTLTYDELGQFVNYAMIFMNSQEHVYELHLKRSE